MKKSVLSFCMLLLSYLMMGQTAELNNFSPVAPSQRKIESSADIKRGTYLKRLIRQETPDHRAQPKVYLLNKTKSDSDNTSVILKVAGDMTSRAGYQMWLDAQADTYGTVIPADNYSTRVSTGDMSEEAFNLFDYKIPANSSRILTDSTLVRAGASEAVSIAPGTYDFCIVYPDFNRFRLGFWLAANTSWSRKDNYNFEKGYTYTFEISSEGNTVFNPPFNLLAEKLELPEDGTLTGSETIKLHIKNPGTEPASGFQVTYQINDGAEVSETVAATLESNGSYIHTFAAKVDMSTPGVYTVKARINWDKDMETENNVITGDVKFPAVHGLPFSENFETQEAVRARWNIINANNDEFTWQYEPYPGSDGEDGYVSYQQYITSSPADDYLISDPIEFPQGGMHLTFDYKTSYDLASEAIEILYGTSADPLEMNRIIRIDSINNSAWKKKIVNFELPEGGNYHIAFRAVSPETSTYGLQIDGINIGVGEYSGTPDLAVTKLILPASSCDVQDTWSIQAIVGNAGDEDITSFALNLQIDNGEIIRQEFSEYLAPEETKTVTIWATTNAFSFPEKKKYVVACTGECDRDPVTDNNSVTAALYHYEPVTELPFRSRFDNEASASDWYTADRQAWVYDSEYTTYENYEDSIPLISRCINLQPGKYRVDIVYSAGLSILGYDAKENFLLSCGISGTDPMAWEPFAELKDQLVKAATHEAVLTITEVGEYCIAVMTTQWGGLDMGLLSVFEINLESIPDHDLQLKDFGSSTLTAQIPAKQLGGNHSFQMSILNRGISNERNVTVEIRNNENLLATSNTLEILEPDTLALVYAQSEVPVWTAGTEITLRAMALAENDIQSEELTYSFIVSDTVYARDKTTGYINGVGAKTPISFGNLFTLSAADTLTSLSVGFVEKAEELPVDIAVYRLGTDNKILSTVVKQTETRPGMAGLQTYRLPARLLEPGSYYFEITQKGDDNIGVAYDNRNEASFYASSGDSLVAVGGYGNIMIRANFGHDADLREYDLTVKEIIRPRTNGVFKSNETITAVIENNGYKTAENASVHCSVNGSELPVYNLSSLNPYASKEISFTADLSRPGEYRIRIWATWENDAYPENDFAEKELTCKEKSTIYEMNFEECENFATENFSPAWTTLDLDNAPTARFQAYLFKHAGEPLGFIAFNPYATTPSMEYLPAILPHSGERFGACFSSQEIQNNDWLISPKLKLGEGSSLELYVKTYVDNYGLECYRLLISETDNQPVNFTVLGDIRTAPVDDWEKVEVDLSHYDGKEVYVAVQCVSNDAFVFMVDDIRVLTSPSSVQNTAGNDLHIYPNPVQQGNAMKIESANDPIVSVSVYDTYGKIIFTDSADGSVFYLLATDRFEPGIYILQLKTGSEIKNLRFIIIR